MRNIVIKASETVKLNDYLNTNYKELQLLGTVNDVEVKSMDSSFLGFYQKYQKEILSFLPEDKKKIYDETGIRVCNYLTLNGSEEDKIYLSVTLGSVHFHRRGTQYTNYDENYKLKEKEYLDNMSNGNIVHSSDGLGCDVMVAVEVQDVIKEDDGIYIFDNGQKEKIYSINA